MDARDQEKKGAEFYKECFPAWSARVLAAGRRLPEPERPYTDGVTSATPQSTFLVTTVLPLASMESDFVLRAEVNRSGDYNAAFPAPPEGGFDPLRPDPSIDWDGQPSVVYAATTRIVEKRQSVLLKPVGFGDPGADQQINPDLSKLDTALRIVSEIELTAH